MNATLAQTAASFAPSGTLFDYEHWERQLPTLSTQYRGADPYPHIVLDNFLTRAAIQHALQDFPAIDSGQWINYIHYNERKHGFNQLDQLPEGPRRVIQEMNSPRFLAWLSGLTGIQGLLADDALEGGGLHQSQRGGFLNIHADFTVHPHHRHWERRLNLLIYLNPHWEEEWNGYLELWTRDMRYCARRVAPLLNRAVIFSTERDTYHGHPDPLACPPEVTRKSIALYYFTAHDAPPPKQTTDYRARPGQRENPALVWLDKTAVSTYSRLKSTLGLSDDFASRVLGFFGGRKKR